MKLAYPNKVVLLCTSKLAGWLISVIWKGVAKQRHLSSSNLVSREKRKRKRKKNQTLGSNLLK